MDQSGIVSDLDFQPFLKQKGAKWWTMLKLGYDGIMLERMQRQFKAAEKITDIAVTGTNAGVDTLYPSQEDEDMSVNIGNETHNHYHYDNDSTMTASNPVMSPTSIPTATDKPKSSNLLTTALVASLIASGLGGWGLAWYSKTHPPQQTVDTDTDSATDVVFPK